MAKIKLIYNKILALPELRILIDAQRNPDGFAHNVLIRRCVITDCPRSMVATLDYLKIKDSRMAKNIFTSKPKAEYLVNAKEVDSPGLGILNSNG